MILRTFVKIRLEVLCIALACLHTMVSSACGSLLLHQTNTADCLSCSKDILFSRCVAPLSDMERGILALEWFPILLHFYGINLRHLDILRRQWKPRSEYWSHWCMVRNVTPRELHNLFLPKLRAHPLNGHAFTVSINFAFRQEFFIWPTSFFS